MTVVLIFVKACLFGLLICPALGAQSQGHIEQDSMKFSYDSDGGYLVAISHSTCYMVKLTRDEADHVHTNQGMEDLQLKMVHQWLGSLAETRVYHVDVNLPGTIRHWCSKHDIYVLERNSGVQSTVPSAGSTPPSLA